MRNIMTVMSTCLAMLGSATYAQNADLQLLLKQNPSLLKNIPNAPTGQNLANNQTGVPNATSARTPNAEALAQGSDIIFQSQARKATGTSIVKRYFSVLSGETLPVYGAAEFSQQQNQELLFFNTMGRDYRLGAGDIVRLTLRGLNELDTTLKIAQDGKMVVDNLPPVSLNGKTIAQAEAEILSILKLDDASASAFLSLETARLITVQVSGSVETPKTIAVPAYTPLSRVMSYIGGISDTGSLRNIVLRHQDGSIEQVDFYDFLQSPFGSNDPVVTDSSRIFIANQGATIAASGYVARPGIYELPTNTFEIPIKDLLDLSGTTLIPPGSIIEILSFDSSGIAQATPTTLDENIKQGEALRIRFVETRDLANISVMGAVLETYDFAANTSISVREILKNGSVLKNDAKLSFAMILESDGLSRAINLADALQDYDTKVSPGSKLVVFNESKFDQLVNANPNQTTDPLVARISETKIAEIYLNGRRIAFVPPSVSKSFYDIVKPFYSFTPQSILDFSLIQKVENGQTVSTAISLRDVLGQDTPFEFQAGSKLFLFERQFYSKLLKPFGSEDVNLENAISSELNTVGEALNDADVATIFVNGEAFALLPNQRPQKANDILDILGGLPISITNDLAIVSFGDGQREPVAITLNNKAETLIVGDVQVDFFTKNGLRSIVAEIDSGRNDTLAANIKAYSNTIYIDGQLVAAFGQVANLKNTGFADILKEQQNIYPIFALISEYSPLKGLWNAKSYTINQLVNKKLDTKPGARFDLLTKEFLWSLSGNNTESEVVLNFTGDNTLSEDNTLLSRSMSPNTQKRLPPSLTLEALENASRFVGGAVETPASYPTAQTVTLAELVNAAGGFTNSADVQNIILREYVVNAGVLTTAKERRINSEITNLETVTLSGPFSVDVTAYINDAFSGSITLSGEVNRPGEYIFARSETLHDVIERASGFSDAAYPLGAVFERISAKEEEKASNALLASKVEQSVLQLSTSDTQGAGDQINAVLGFANQLKQQESAGRLSINVLMRDASVPVFLQDGDRLIVPKRPAHVSIIGSVSHPVRANYSPDKKLSDYISNSGGYTRVADKRRTYMLLPNGEAAPMTEDTIIPPGAVLIVPPKTDKLSVLGLTDLVSRVLGNIATSILAINNVK